MISPQEIRSVTFDKVMRGYRPEDVDAFLQQVAQDMEQLAADNADKEKKLYILAEKIEEYRRDEDNLKTALLNAQRMGESVIREAKQKAESILREAGIRADTLTRVAQEQCEEEQQELERVKAEVAHFKNTLLAMYKQHIELISGLPGDEEPETEEPAQEQESAVQEEPAQPAASEAEPAQEPEAQPVQQEQQQEDTQFPDLAELYGDQSAAQQPDTMLDTVEEFFDEDFAAQTFTSAQPEKAEETKEETREPEQTPAFQGFKGIQFTD